MITKDEEKGIADAIKEAAETWRALQDPDEPLAKRIIEMHDKIDKQEEKKEISAEKDEEPSEDEEKDDELKILHSKEKTICHELASHFLSKYKILTLTDTQEIFIYDKGIYLPIGESVIAAETQKLLGKNCKLHSVREILGHVRRSTFRDRKNVSEPENKLCLENGILDLDALKIEEHSPDIIFFNKLPVKYVAKAKCPAIEKFLAEIVNKEEVMLLQEFTGYCLYKKYFIHKAFMLVGNGANGKSTFLNLLKAFLGHENVSSVPLQQLEGNRFAVASLYCKLANIFADLSSRALNETSYFKSLTGQDPIAAEKKFRDQFFFTSYCKLIFSANQIPKSPEDTDAFFRRWIIINFPNQFLKNADKHIIDKLTTETELSGFLLFSIAGLKRLKEQGDFSFTKSIQDVRLQYVRMSDSVGAFQMDKILIKPDGFIAKKELYVAYCDYCRQNGYPVKAENIFHRELQAKIRIEDYKTWIDSQGARGPCWKGIQLNSAKEQNNLAYLDRVAAKVKVVKVVRVKSLLKQKQTKQK